MQHDKVWTTADTEEGTKFIPLRYDANTLIFQGASFRGRPLRALTKNGTKCKLSARRGPRFQVQTDDMQMPRLLELNA